ncbi:MAG: chitobiase/beta-hexosaminidase C-terminal domain-containing protein, partial [Sedimentisphaerales bacterium]|nr:chitobiase/beta-hexosaminidase C-terminal domain-containing protein [Sedimentisphaerales bacterium]
MKPEATLITLITAMVILGINIEAMGGYQPVEGHIMTRWAKEVRPDNALPEYPRPMMIRNNWMNINGLWDYAVTAKDAVKPGTWDGEILVPYPIESALSGVKKTVRSDQALWYHKNVALEKPQNQRVLLHLGAVDWECTIWVNGQEVSKHKGGYDPISVDITDVCNNNGEQEIIIRAWDPTFEKDPSQPRGKQYANPEGIWYTNVTGIWQTIWVETVSETYIQNVNITPDVDNSSVIVEPIISDSTGGATICVTVKQHGETVTQEKSGPSERIALFIKNPRLWSPDDPYLYDLEVVLSREGRVLDTVKSYFGMRKISLGTDADGRRRLFLNNEPLFQFGPLDQGWWPDGLYTAPTDEALRYDVEVTKAWGFNMLRKHVKVEPQRFYYWCDKLGILVWQDMPSSLLDRKQYHSQQLEQIDAQWEREWKRIITALHNHPSIVMWVPFNEGWGQYDTQRIVAWTKNLDPSRLVNNASGWTDKHVGDVHDTHEYPGPGMGAPEAHRAVVLGEFGGLGLPVEGHLWNQGERNWGYRTYQTEKDLEDKYIEVIRNTYHLIPQGLSAAVYTQTTDVETEVNGLMTYDRKVIKLAPDRIASLNKGYSPPYFVSQFDEFYKTTSIELAADPGSEIRYTLDGSTPDMDAKKYAESITISQETT